MIRWSRQVVGVGEAVGDRIETAIGDAEVDERLRLVAGQVRDQIDVLELCLDPASLSRISDGASVGSDWAMESGVGGASLKSTDGVIGRYSAEDFAGTVSGGSAVSPRDGDGGISVALQSDSFIYSSIRNNCTVE